MYDWFEGSATHVPRSNTDGYDDMRLLRYHRVMLAGGELFASGEVKKT